MSNDLFGLPQKKPSRVSDPSARPEPQAPDFTPAAPWFVSEEKEQKNTKYSPKNITKRLVSILFPLLGILAIGLVVAAVIQYAVGMYE